MNIVVVGDNKYILHRAAGSNETNAKKIRSTHGGVLLKDSNGLYIVCSKIEEIEHEEI